MRTLKLLLLWPVIFLLFDCQLANHVKWQNSAGVSFEVYGPSGGKVLALATGEKPRAWSYWDYDSSEAQADWGVSLRAGRCTYRYKQPDIDAIQAGVAHGISTVRPFLLIVDPQFVIHLEYPKNWRWEKPAITGFPAVPSVTCQGGVTDE